MTDESRRFTRVPFKVNAEMIANDIAYHSKEISNLSIGGCLLPVTATLDQGTPCQMKIFLEGAGDEVNVSIEGEIVRADPDAVAIKFTRIDPDSLFHLQNIIKYNSPDADMVEGEINKHPGLL
jgi:hypothetical protein